ncbi:hypothetical protein NBRC116188_13460 [Oceaniserpentilla sp. 4NH20-0058]|uniref:twin-arginine translocation signal domain-containing protein n=1 Tax=Oceaniserpentilla sp. 4NH20-0058 TaxID=3127660 RepID=UPI003104ECFF
MNRRDFLKLGAASSAALTVTSLTATLSGCSDSLPANSKWLILRESDRTLLTAIMPVMLKGHFPTTVNEQADAIQQVLLIIDGGLAKFGPHNIKQVQELFTLLNFGLSRGLTTGVWSKWENASEAEIEHFLQRWRDSSVSLFNLGYNGLNKLIAASWYGLPEAWLKTGYPGPLYPDVLITKNNSVN